MPSQEELCYALVAQFVQERYKAICCPSNPSLPIWRVCQLASVPKVHHGSRPRATKQALLAPYICNRRVGSARESRRSLLHMQETTRGRQSCKGLSGPYRLCSLYGDICGQRLVDERAVGTGVGFIGKRKVDWACKEARRGRSR
jgi:hypothetical protein